MQNKYLIMNLLLLCGAIDLGAVSGKLHGLDYTYKYSGRKAVDHFNKTFDGSNSDFTGLDLRQNIEAIVTSNSVKNYKLYFDKSNLSHTNLSYTDLRHLSLVGADLRDVDLTRSDLTGVDLTGADLRGAVLLETILTGAKMTGAKMPANPNFYKILDKKVKRSKSTR